METDTSAQDRRELPDSVVRAELERILASEVFSRSQQLRRLLSFIVEQRLAGQGHSLKESVLAHEVYGKGTDFDGGADPVVRVDARRLRDKLREYYDGRSDPVVISLPKGSYVPVFEANSASPHPHGSSSCSGGAGATANAAGSELQAHEDRGQRTGDRRCDCRSGTCVARSHQAGERSNPTAPFGFVPRCGRTTCLVPGRRPRRLRLVRPSRAWSNGYLCESRRE